MIALEGLDDLGVRSALTLPLTSCTDSYKAPTILGLQYSHLKSGDDNPCPVNTVRIQYMNTGKSALNNLNINPISLTLR